MSDSAPRLTPSELPKVKNPQALNHLNVAIGNLILAGTYFCQANQEQHDAMTDQVLDLATKLLRQVTK